MYQFLIQAFIHVSTAYSNCDIYEINEQIYTPPLHPQKILDAVELVFWML